MALKPNKTRPIRWGEGRNPYANFEDDVRWMTQYSAKCDGLIGECTQQVTTIVVKGEISYFCEEHARG